jgi:hypothetical protein
MRMLGIDIIEWQIEEARSVARRAPSLAALASMLSASQIKVEKMKCHCLELLEDMSFDGVCTMQSLSQRTTPSGPLRASFARCVQADASRVEVERRTATEDEGLNDRLTQVMRMVNDYTVMPTNEAARFGYFRDLLEEAGFVNVEVRDWRPISRPLSDSSTRLLRRRFPCSALLASRSGSINMICAASAYLGRDAVADRPGPTLYPGGQLRFVLP